MSIDIESMDISIQDLQYVEADLSDDELTSILFILYIKTRPDMVLNNESSRSKGYLTEFAKKNNDWKTLIVEALVIAGIFEIVNNLGISNEEAKIHLSRSMSTDQYVKQLFEICDNNVELTTSKLIECIRIDCDSAKDSSSRMLEIYLAHLRLKNLLDFNNPSTLKKYSTEIDDENFMKQVAKLPAVPQFDSIVNSMAANHINSYKSAKMKVLIINQETFYREENPQLKCLLPRENLKERRGTKQDMIALEELYRSFGYDVTVMCNLKNNEILAAVAETTKSSNNCDGLIVCLLSHGHEGIFYGHNSIPVRTKDVKLLMSSQLLLGKPKILLVQACQGNAPQKSIKKEIEEEEVEYDGPSLSNIVSGSQFADFLIFWSTIEGFASIRHVEKGTWFIQELTSMIKSMHNSNHLVDICTSVIREVSLKRGYQDECMLPKFETTFTKSFYFPQKN